MRRALFCVVPESEHFDLCIELDQRLRTGRLRSGVLRARHPSLAGLLTALGGGWQASAGASAGAESDTGTQAHAVAAQPEPAVTLPAAG
ncbi:hypothetical protein [Burkholderia contaminans]|uniref:hypothetical protein n=1 Tax=Burkholderia contaminans TaxID=488447 RepID=UPI002D807AEC|nr:hypothetical protein [Burkholderia contaminans]